MSDTPLFAAGDRVDLRIAKLAGTTTGTLVTVVRQLGPDEADDEVGPMYEVLLHVFEDELARNEDDEPTPWPPPGPLDHESQLYGERRGGMITTPDDELMRSRTARYIEPFPGWGREPAPAGGNVEYRDARKWAEAEIERAWAEPTSV